MKRGWQRKQLGELAELKGRIGWRGLTAKEYTKSGPLFLSVHSLNYGDYVDFRDAFHISEERYIESPEIMLQEDDVLICKDGAGIGKVGIVGTLPDRTTINSSLLLIRSGKEILPKFLYRCLSSPYFQQIVNSRLNGATTPHLYQRDITEFPVVLPTLPEQQRIVGLLDEGFEGIAKARTNAERNFQNAHALFESHLHSVLTQRGNGWMEKRLGDVCSIARGGSPRPIQKFLTTANNGINWIKISDATASGKYIYKTEEKIIPEGAKRSRIVQDGDFLLSNSMSFGRPYIMRTSGCIHDGWLVLSNYASQLDQDYLYYVLGSQFVFQQFDRLAAGSTVRNLNIELASRAEIPVPPLKQQQAIAHDFDALAAKTQRLASLYERKLAALEALKRSLLHQGFTGNL